ncbi:MAG: GtrA family protein [Sphingobacteriales bacterium]|nr:MAG: GtrA family protein [Sphingobacteriales bacterium]
MFSISPTVFFKFLKFSIVGFSGIFIDFGITYLLKQKLNVPKYVANSTGFVFATLSNYYLNRIWTFKTTQVNAFIQFEKFFIISLIGLIISNTLIYLLNEKLKLNFWLCKILAIGLVSFFNFFANYIYTFAA